MGEVFECSAKFVIVRGVRGHQICDPFILMQIEWNAQPVSAKIIKAEFDYTTSFVVFLHYSNIFKGFH